MIQKIAQIQENDNLHINSFVLEHFQFDDSVKILVLDIDIVIEVSTPTEFHRAQVTLKFKNNERNLYLLILLFQK